MFVDSKGVEFSGISHGKTLKVLLKAAQTVFLCQTMAPFRQIWRKTFRVCD